MTKDDKPEDEGLPEHERSEVAAAVAGGELPRSALSSVVEGANPEGFTGASPYEIAERYATGDIDHTEMMRHLSVWPYVKKHDPTE